MTRQRVAGSRDTSNLDLHSQLDDAVGRQPKVGGGRLGIARHEREEMFAPARQPAALAGDDRLWRFGRFRD